MNIVLNEYVYSNNETIDLNTGQWKIQYEPLECVPVVSLQGIAVFGLKESHQFLWSGGGDRMVVQNSSRGKRVASSSFDPRTGVIEFCWDTYPGEHALCVSYHFSEPPKEPEKTQPLSWMKEGF